MSDTLQMSKRSDKRKGEDGNSPTTPRMSKKQKMDSSTERSEENIAEAKSILRKIDSNLHVQQVENCSSPQKLIQYIRQNISKLDYGGVKKKTTVGVVGKTGAGKSSLINTILGEKHLLPSGSVSACTSVIIQVEANVTDSNYTAEIEFIPKEGLTFGVNLSLKWTPDQDIATLPLSLLGNQSGPPDATEWEDELKTLLDALSDLNEERDDAMVSTANEKITALYGEKGVDMTHKELMKDENFSGIPEFLVHETKKITCEKASDLSDQIGSYVQHDESNPGGCYWPVVKSVNIKVPHCKDFLEHVMIVDLPGTGDYNKTRDQMWRSKLKECSTVWIVSEINRAGSDKEAWNLVSNSITDMEHGGECKSISFICTKTDDIDLESYMRSAKLKDENLQITPKDPKYNDKRKSKCIIHRNKKAKETVHKSFKQLPKFKKHFNCGGNFLSVFTVSSTEFTRKDPILTRDETEIPKLKNLLRRYNDSHKDEMATHYVNGALGVINLVQGFQMKNRSSLHKNFRINLDKALEELQADIVKIFSCLEKHLSKGAKDCEVKCITTAKELTAPENKDGRGFHRTLTALCKNDGFYRSKAGETDLNRDLVKPMLQQINGAFSDFFPVEGKLTGKSLQESIDKFTIIQENVIREYGNSAVLQFLKNQEMKLKTMLKQEIVERKKKIYDSLTESIKFTMLPCYQEAAADKGSGSMKRKQELLLNHIKSSKSSMFLKARQSMLELLANTMKYITQKMRKALMESLEHSVLNTNPLPNQDFAGDLEALKEVLAHIQD